MFFIAYIVLPTGVNKQRVFRNILSVSVEMLPDFGESIDFRFSGGFHLDLQ
jgi:hypothetical protein